VNDLYLSLRSLWLYDDGDDSLSMFIVLVLVHTQTSIRSQMKREKRLTGDEN